MFQVHIVAVSVRNQDQAREFYVKQLGCEVRVDRLESDGTRFLEVAPPGGGTRIALALETPERPAGGPSGITLNTDDLDTARRLLVERGVVFVQEPVPMPNGGARSVFADLDGNTFVLQRHPHRAPSP